MRVGGEHGIDVVGVEHEHPQRGARHQRRLPVPVAEHGQLADDLAWPDRSHGRTADAGGRPTVENDEGVLFELAFVAQLGAGVEIPLDGQVRDISELTLAAMGEELDLRQRGALLLGAQLRHRLPLASCRRPAPGF